MLLPELNPPGVSFGKGDSGLVGTSLLDGLFDGAGGVFSPPSDVIGLGGHGQAYAKCLGALLTGRCAVAAKCTGDDNRALIRPANGQIVNCSW